MMRSYSKYLIVGATGDSGVEIVNMLLSKGSSVRILVRNVTKAKTIFKENYEKLDRVVEHELGLSQVKGEEELKLNKDLLESIEWCDVLICSLGVHATGDPQKTDYFGTVELIKHCEKSQTKFADKLFVYISTIYITRPYTFIAYLLNSIMPYVVGWKALAENKLRQSGFNYLIVRPGGLTNKTEAKTVLVDQGDRIKGYIARKNLAIAVLNFLSDPNVNKGKVTVEVIEKSTSEGLIELKNPIKEDDKNSIVTADHFRATRNITFSIFAVITLFAAFLIWRFK